MCLQNLHLSDRVVRNAPKHYPSINNPQLTLIVCVIRYYDEFRYKRILKFENPGAETAGKSFGVYRKYQ